ncbi:MAG TPA: pyruvate kinase [Chitinophagaceae bacterium]|nr:pyruvate kinase [Chitinophagaceae bacterium]
MVQHEPVRPGLSFPEAKPEGPMEHLRAQLSELERKMLQTVYERQDLIDELHPDQQMAARNLLHYLTLRSEDIRSLQDQLHIFGLSSLASSESHIHRQLQAILQRLGENYADEDLDDCTYQSSRLEVKQKALSLFGEKNDSGVPYIMVTFDSSFADNYGQIKNLLQNGMNIARINCAQDDEKMWAKMIHLVRKACRKTGLKCKIYMDLAGPKIRTKLLTKGRKKGRVKVQEGQLIWLAEKVTSEIEDDIVISCTEKGIVQQLKKGEKVLFDDGIVRGNIEIVEEGRVGLRILRISSEKSVIKEKKGINFPESALNISPLTKFDEECLPFICEYADLLGFSFVRNGSDLVLLQHKLRKITEKPPRLIVKIEAVEAVRNLPSLLLQGMHQETFGVMIARGDLAVEVGFERMSEVQEEILWICEAAHAPVIWATQVLETLNKCGIATRSEITDAAHAVMAECVMINKGPHTIEVIETLRDILQRSGGHHVKKRFIFRPLSIAQNFLNG